MIESEERASNVAAQKAKIRERYKGVDSDILDVIPAKEHPSLYEDTKEMQVGVYARVSTDDPRQTSSYELQKNHYHDVIGQHVGWVLYDIYADAADIIGLNQKPEANGRRFSPFSLVSAHFKTNGGCNCLI